MRILTRFPRLLRAYWRYICVWIPISSIIYELFFGNVFIFFPNMPLLVWGLLFAKRTLFFHETWVFAAASVPQTDSNRRLLRFLLGRIWMCFHIFEIKPVRKLPFLTRVPCNAMFSIALFVRFRTRRLVRCCRTGRVFQEWFSYWTDGGFSF